MVHMRPEREKMTITAQDVGTLDVPPDVGDLVLHQATPEQLDSAKPPSMVFTTGQNGRFFFRLSSGEEVFRVEPDGQVFVHGNKVDTDLEVYQAIRAWLVLAVRVNPDGTETPVLPR